MARPKKYPEVPTNPNPNGNELTSSTSGDDSIVKTVIEEHKTSGDDLLTLASQSLQSLPVGKNHQKNANYKANLKARKAAVTSANQEEISTIVITLLTLIISGLNIPSNIKPNEEEVNGFSVPVTRLLLRHIPVVSKLSADALDIIGILGTISAYYIRTGDDWKTYRATIQAEKLKTAENSPVVLDVPIPIDDPLTMLRNNRPATLDALT